MGILIIAYNWIQQPKKNSSDIKELKEIVLDHQTSVMLVFSSIDETNKRQDNDIKILEKSHNILDKRLALLEQWKKDVK